MSGAEIGFSEVMRGRGGAAWLGWYHVTSGFHLVFIGGQPDCTGSPLVSTVHTMRLFLSLLLLSLSPVCRPSQVPAMAGDTPGGTEAEGEAEEPEVGVVVLVVSR